MMIEQKIHIKTPDCKICNTKFDKIEYPNIHMQKVHNESDNDRMNRLTEMIQSLENNQKEKLALVTEVEDDGEVEPEIVIVEQDTENYQSTSWVAE